MSRIKSLKAKKETLILQMQFFCLDPQFKIFEDICNSNLRHEGKFFDMWKMAALATYGQIWLEQEFLDNFENKYGLHKSNLYEFRDNYIKLKKELFERVGVKPTASNIDVLWYLYFASGDANIILHAFKAGGNTDIKNALRETIIDMYIRFSDEYRKKIDYIKSLPNYISGHEIGSEMLQKIIKNFDTIEKIIMIESQKEDTQHTNTSTLQSTTKELKRIDLT